MGLVGLYACIVRRLRTEERNAAYFLGFIGSVGFLGLLRSCCCFSWFVLCCCLGCFAPVVCGFLLGCWRFFFPSDDCDKKKGRTVLARPLFVGCGWFYMFSAAFIVSSFDFEKIHPAPQVRCALNLPPMAFSVSLIARVSPTIAMAFSE